MIDKNHKIKAVAQILLVVSLTISFSYIYGEIYGGPGLEIVSAQDGGEEEITPPTDQQIANLKSEYVTFQEYGDEELRDLLVNLVEDGLITEADYDNPQLIIGVMDEQFSQHIEGSEAGEFNGGLFGIISRILDVLGFVPQALNVAGGAFQRALFDNTGGLYICEESLDNEICQIFTGNQIDSVCPEDKQTKLDTISGEVKIPEGHPCELGFCYDPNEGDCGPNTPRAICDDSWYEPESSEGLAVCQRGCCILGGNYNFVTAGQCQKMADFRDVNLGEGNNLFNPALDSEPACVGEAARVRQSTAEGACVSESSDTGDVTCRFVTGDECSSSGGTFLGDVLCSNQEEIEDLVGRELEATVCEGAFQTACVEGRDEVYWFDSCGNRENIFEGDSVGEKESSLNGGFVKGAGDLSCDPLADPENCGLCNRARSSICSADGESARCVDMSCKDASGQKREHGESWCAYQSSIGLVGPDLPGVDTLWDYIIPGSIKRITGGTRSTDTPGSTHFRMECDNGVVKEPFACQPGRKELCVETRVEKDGGGEFSQASCVLNRWQECFAYNPSTEEGRAIGLAGPQAAWRILDAKLSLTCGQDPHCFVKRVDLTEKATDSFKFGYCAPRYPPGFDLRNQDSGSPFCSQASQTCTAVFVKHLFGGWKCEGNCECVDGEDPGSAKPSSAFINEMNSFCTSLGDCGSSVNYIGAQAGGKGYSASTGESIYDRFLGFSSFTDLIPFSLNIGDGEAVKGEYIDASAEGLLSDFDEFLGGNGLFDIFDKIDEFLNGVQPGGNYGVPDVPEEGVSATPALYAGGVGTAILAGGWLASGAGSFMELAGIAHAGGLSSSATAAQVAGFGAAVTGAALGAALVGFMIDILGLGPGMPAALSLTFMGAGAVGGAIIATSIFESGSIAGACANPVGCIIVVVVIIVLLIFKFIFGVGEVKEVPVNFECKPWVPPTLGVSQDVCGSCGVDDLSDGGEQFPCNQYSCEALGRDCVFVPELEGGGNEGVCIYSPSSDTSAPRLIGTLEDSLEEGFRYGGDFQEGPPGGRFSIEKIDGRQGCLDSLESVEMGFEVSEPANCYFSGQARESSDGMIPIVPLDVRDRTKFEFKFSSIDADRLGLEDFRPEERNDVNLYLVCEDRARPENNNIGQEHVVELCVVPDDTTATRIIIPEMDTLPFGTEEHELIFYTTEPAECRWEFNDKSYFEMENDADCKNSLRERQGIGFGCSADIPLSRDRTTVYIRCLDRPEWQGTDRESQRNENVDGVPAEIVRSDNSLQIDYVSPDGETITAGQSGVVVTLEASTSGGLDGSATCDWKLEGGGFSTEYTQFDESGGTSHRQAIGERTSKLREADYEVMVRCVDNAGNEAERAATFRVEIDEDIPSITRLYSDSGFLFIVTNEPTECSYLNVPLEGKTNACDFRVDEGIAMEVQSGTNGQTHTAEFGGGKAYHIKCQDVQGNQIVGQCNEIVERGF